MSNPHYCIQVVVFQQCALKSEKNAIWEKLKLTFFVRKKIPKGAALKFILAFEFGGNHIQIGYCTFSHF